MNVLKKTMALAAFAFLPMTMCSCGGDEGPSVPGVPAPPPVERPSVAELMNTLWNETSYLNLDSRRKAAMDEMQVYADMCPNTAFKNYYASVDPVAIAAMENNSMIGFHHDALKRVLDQVKTEVVPVGTVVLWQVYNMGYVVKTPTHTFAIDLKHKFAEEFAPFIEFLCITHAHDDHYTHALVDAMAAAGKPVYSNFIDNGYMIGGAATISPCDGISMEVKIADHNSELKNFVVNYQIDCGADTGHAVILHTGDSHNHTQLLKTRDIDIFIPHLAVGLNMAKAVERLDPRIVLMSHILELDHPVEKWRWSYQYGINEVEKLNRQGVYLPVWGEKITYKK